LTELGDAIGLVSAFDREITVARTLGHHNHYVVASFYADALAKLDRPEARDYFEEALRTEVDSKALVLNSYSKYLLRHNDPSRALEILNDAGSLARLAAEQPVFLRREALRALGQDTSSADAEVAILKSRLSGQVAGGRPAALLGGDAAQLRSINATWHNATDDCRNAAYTNQLVCPNGNGWCYWPYTVNLAEVMFNEALGETVGARGAVGWTVRNRGRQTIDACAPGTFVGGLNAGNATRDALPCGLTSAECVTERAYCWAEHGGTFTPGSTEYQFADWHVDKQVLYDNGFLPLAFNMINGWVPDMAGGFIPAGVGACMVQQGQTTCGNYLCFSGQNSWQGSALGPMEFRSVGYTPAYPACEYWAWNTGYVCPNGYPDNIFANRYQ
jgi:hypothetical protein